MNEPKRVKIDNVEYVRADQLTPNELDGKQYVIVRSHNQEVMAEYLDEHEGQVDIVQANQSTSNELDEKPYVIVRSRNQGVMSGYLDKYEGQVVHLSRARQLWQWKSDFLLPELADKGPKPEGCKFSCEMSQQMIMLEACGILFCSAAAGAAIRAVPAQVK